LFRAPEVTDQRPVIAYDATMHPNLARPGKMLFSYNVNSLNHADAYADATLYRPRLRRGRLAARAAESGRPAAAGADCPARRGRPRRPVVGITRPGEQVPGIPEGRHGRADAVGPAARAGQRHIDASSTC
jgi:hypothetical protein